MSAMDDVFGSRPYRPDHPDLWRISEIVLEHDGAIDAAQGEDEKEKVWRDKTGAVVDVASLTYMGVQRAIKAFGNPLDPASPLTPGQQSTVAAIFIEAFVFGATFEKRGGHQER